MHRLKGMEFSMKKIISIISFFITTTCMMPCYATTNDDQKTMNAKQTIYTNTASKEFIKLFDYEIQNRAFALNTMKTAAEDSANRALPFFKAYLALEELNQKLYSPIATKHELNMMPRWWTRTRTTLGLWGAALLPDVGLKVAHRITVDYVPQLEELESLSPEEDKAFFNYVVAQEKAQADASGMILKGNVEQAAGILKSFVQKHKGFAFN